MLFVMCNGLVLFNVYARTKRRYKLIANVAMQMNVTCEKIKKRITELCVNFICNI